jgi:hypothetical protein
MRFSDEYKPYIHNLHVTQTEGNSTFGLPTVIMSGYLRMVKLIQMSTPGLAHRRVSTREITVLAIVGSSLAK